MLVVSSWERKLIFEIHTKNERSKAFDLASEVAGILQKSNIYEAFRAIVDFHDFMQDRHPELFG